MAHSEEVRAAVIAALLAGQGVSETADQYKLPKQTVANWKKTLTPEQMGQIKTKKGERFGDLVGTYLEETLNTLAVQVRHFRDPAWLAKQPADGLAVLHGVCTDKAIRLLEAAERARDLEDAEAE